MLLTLFQMLSQASRQEEARDRYCKMSFLPNCKQIIFFPKLKMLRLPQCWGQHLQRMRLKNS